MGPNLLNASGSAHTHTHKLPSVAASREPKRKLIFCDRACFSELRVPLRQWRYGLFRRPFAPAFARYGPSYACYSYFGLHPMLLGALSGVLIWVGNAAVLLGRDVGPAFWIRQLLSSVSGTEWAPEAWEEVRATLCCPRRASAAATPPHLHPILTATPPHVLTALT